MTPRDGAQLRHAPHELAAAPRANGRDRGPGTVGNITGCGTATHFLSEIGGDIYY
jgi:hypothetical protein